LPARRVRRAAPLPNSLRGSAAIRTSGTVLLLKRKWLIAQAGSVRFTQAAAESPQAAAYAV
jgi:hypothetical protein